jgi:hypothetical protein
VHPFGRAGWRLMAAATCGGSNLISAELAPRTRLIAPASVRSQSRKFEFSSTPSRCACAAVRLVRPQPLTRRHQWVDRRPRSGTETLPLFGERMETSQMTPSARSCCNCLSS